MIQVQTGDVVQIHYKGQLETGEEFGSSYGGAPIQFAAGSEEMLSGISKAVLGMEQGQKKSITLGPEEAFGPRDESLEQEIPREVLPKEAKVGDQFIARAGEQQLLVWVRQLDENTAVVDGNHPLAGLTLTFEIELIGVKPPGKEDNE